MKDIIKTNDMLDVVQASKIMGISESYLRKLVQFRKVPFYYGGPRKKKIFFDQDQIESWINPIKMDVEK